MRVRPLLAHQYEPLRTLRLRALRTDPNAFGSTYARETARTPQFWQRWASESAAADMQCTFIAGTRENAWAGLALIRVDPEPRHNDDGHEDDHVGHREAELLSMWVAPEARGRGAARRLTEACLDWATAQHCQRVHLTVVADNRPALAAYRSAGFIPAEPTSWIRDGARIGGLVLVRELHSAAGPIDQPPDRPARISRTDR